MQFFTVLTVVFLPLATASQIASPQFTVGANFTVGQDVRTSSGLIVGHASGEHPQVSEYLGIPYAQSPVGKLRFAAPVRYTGSSSFNASAFGTSCPPAASQGQSPPTAEEIAASNITDVGLRFLETIGNPPGAVYGEDCLHLNVWTKPQSGEPLKAVMMFIHGGGFTGGSSTIPFFDGAYLADREDVVVVTFNYRLSILGFPGNPDSQNNLAFLDQRLAIEFVRDNIARFGGDPARITLFGQSAGAASADYYAYAFASDPIVTGLIEQSGNTFAFGLPYSANASAAAWYSVSDAVGCGNASTDSTILLTCMREVEYSDILRAVPNQGIYALLSAFGPTADDSIVFSDYSQRTPAKVPLMIGSNNYEAGQFRTELALGNLTFADSDWNELNLADYTCPAGRRANASLTASVATWRYRFHGVYPNINISSEGGAYHGAELPLIFGTTFSTPNATAEEVDFEAYIQNAWTAFAKDPVNGLRSAKYQWPLYDPSKDTLIRLAYNNLPGKHLASPELYDSGCADASLSDLLCRLFGQC